MLVGNVLEFDLYDDENRIYFKAVLRFDESAKTATLERVVDAESKVMNLASLEADAYKTKLDTLHVMETMLNKWKDDTKDLWTVRFRSPDCLP